MRILITLNSSNFGGIEKTVLDLIKGLSKDHEVFCVCPTGDYFDEYKKNARVFAYKKVTKIDLKYIFYLKKILQKEKIDVLHANDPRIIFNSLIAGYLAGTKVKISHTHTPVSSWQISDFSKKINIFMNRLIVNLFSDYEICLNETIRKQKEAEGIDPEKLFVIPNCLDTGFKALLEKKLSKKISPKDSHFNFLCISRFSVEKNHILLLEAFYELSKLYKNATLTLVGKGPMQIECKNLVTKYRLEKRVTIISEVEEEEKVELLLNCDAFVFPTLAEGFGLVMIEAMTCSKQVLVSDLPVLVEVSDNRVIYFKNNDKLDLLKKMLQVLEGSIDSSLEENREFVFNKYSFENYVKSYERIYSSKL
jgi:glycosyltransferase involved in cell wall biosynthesis